MLLGKVLKKINQKYKLVKFNSIRFDSRNCRSNDIFFSINGSNLNGNNFINSAIKNGAKIIISNLKFEGYKNKILYIHSKNPRKLLAEAASNLYYRKPRNIIAVTGTNGKTSIANFYFQILNLNKKKAASIGTLGVYSNNLKLSTNNTTIDPVNIHKILNNLKKININNVILEASSHGLKQQRLHGINFKSALFTNLSRDHLDYHKTFEDYLDSKLILFKELLKKRGNIVFDEKIMQAKQLNQISKNRKLKKYTLGLRNSFIRILNIKKIGERKIVEFILKNKKYSFETEIIGDIQIKNLFFSIIAAYLSNLNIEAILKSIPKVKPISGRLEKISFLKNNAKVILDYAHTPEALKVALLNLKEEYPLSKISLVFGCGGNRDKDKRPLMGAIAGKFSDSIYLTDDNPRFENPRLIRNQIKKGIKNKKFKEIPSRSEAIFRAIKELNSGDVLIVAGKGHEKYQEYKTKKFFSDKNEILNAVKKKNLTLSNSIKVNILREKIKKNILKSNSFINYASINSKEIKKNSIFVGVKGKKFDGNFYADSAIKNGAVLAISNKKSKNPKIIFKKNPLNFFSEISTDYRKSLGANNIAITGSAGKTSVKELLGFCLQKLSKIYYSKKSFNNKYGVPLSIFNTPEKTKFVVLEAGMDKKGEIDFLTNMIKPDIGLITNISYAHIKNFKNLDQIAKAKAEIINNIIRGGIFVANRDDNYFNFFLKEAKRKKIKTVTFSEKHKDADVFILQEKKTKEGYLITFKIHDKIKSFLIPKQLQSYKQNILACLVIISNFFQVENLNKNLFYKFKIPEGRGSVINYKKKQKQLTIVDESYNSNPLSLKFALEKFDKKYNKKNKKFILIGDMLELGSHSKELHESIAKYINKSKINKVYTYGKLTKYTYDKITPQIKGKMLKNRMEIVNLIKNDLPNNSFLMVKGSNSTGLNKIIQNL